MDNGSDENKILLLLQQQLDQYQEISRSARALALGRIQALPKRSQKQTQSSSQHSDDNGGLARVLVNLLHQTVHLWLAQRKGVDKTAGTTSNHHQRLLGQMLTIVQNVSNLDVTLAEEVAACAGCQDLYHKIINEPSNQEDDDKAKEGEGEGGGCNYSLTQLQELAGQQIILFQKCHPNDKDEEKHEVSASPRAEYTRTELQSRLPMVFVLPRRQPNNYSSKNSNNIKNDDDWKVLIQQVTSAETEQHNVGFVMWPSAVMLARSLALDPAIICQSQGSILELGAGCGLVGLTAAFILQQEERDQLTNEIEENNAAATPAQTNMEKDRCHPIFTDYDPVVLQNLLRNIRLNNLDRCASVAGLDFFDQQTLEQQEEQQQQYGTTSLALPIENATTTTTTNTEPSWFDMDGQARPPVRLILAADILCYSNDATLVAQTIHATLIPGGKALLMSADENARFGVQHFPEACQTLGLEIMSEDLWTDQRLLESGAFDDEIIMDDDRTQPESPSQTTTGYGPGDRYNLRLFTIEKPMLSCLA